MKILRWFCDWLERRSDDEWSFRSKAGVKVIVRGPAGRASVDLTDPKTREIMRQRLAEFAKYDVEDGRLVKRAREGER